MSLLGFQDFLRHLRRNIFVAFLLAVICLLVSSMYSLYSYECGRFEPFLKLGIDKGYYVGAEACSSWGENFEEEIGKLDGIKNIYQISIGSMSIDTSAYKVFYYEDWAWKNWDARLKSGTWFEEYNDKLAYVQVILSAEFSEYSPGDVFLATSTDKVIRCKVKGILQDNTEVMYSQSFHADDMSYNSFYSVPSDETGFILMQKEAADALELWQIPSSSWRLIEYEDDISDEQALENNKRLTFLTSAAGLSYDSFLRVSEEFLEGKVMVYIPMIVSGIVLAMISLFTVAFINVKNGSRYYSIYYLVGANKTECFRITCGNVIGTIAISALFYMVGEKLVDAYTRRENIVFSMSFEARILAVVLYVILGVFMALCMKLAMRKNSPMEVLREHKI